MADPLLVASGPPVAVRGPTGDAELGSVAQATPDDVAPAVERAREALAGWRTTSPHDRTAVLERAARLLTEQADDIARLSAAESGKIIGQARFEAEASADLLAANAHLGRFAGGTLAPSGAVPGGDRDLVWVERVPLGVVAAIIPFNFPIELTIEKAGAALAAGNVVLLKPPPQNPLATIRVARTLHEAGLPDGVLQVVPGGTEVSATLCSAPDVDAVSLTGSVQAGQAVAAATARQLRPLHLELGGNGASIVLPDADLDHVTAEAVRGRTLMNGQACAATKRLLVHRAVVEDVVDRLDDTLADLVLGDPTDEASDLGPLIDPAAGSRVAAQTNEAVRQGATRVRGRPEADGPWFEPALLSGVPHDAAVATSEEIFGPTFTVIPVTDVGEAVDLINGSPFGLTSAVFSADVPRAIAVAEKLDVGGVVINGSNNYRPPIVPFGGVRLSGTGREGLGYTYEELTRTRFIALRGVRSGGRSPNRDADG